MQTGNELSQLETEFAAHRARFTALGLVMPEDMALEGWAAVGRKLCRADAVMKWWLGDWAAFGLRKYGQLKEFAEANEINYQSLRDMAWVSQSVALSRRRDNLEWSFHREVAALPAREQARWLDRAVDEKLPVAGLRQQIRLAKGEQNALESDGPAVKFALKSADDLEHWLKSRPAEFWTEERRVAVKERLSGIVEFYQRL